MTTLKQLLNCALYDENQTNLGQINNVMFDKSSGKCLLATDRGVYCASKFRCNDKGVVASNLQLTEKNCPSLLDKEIYNLSGKRLGTVADAIIGKTANVIKLISDNGIPYTRGRIAAIKDIILIKKQKPAQKKETRKREQAQARAKEQPHVKPVEITANDRSVRSVRRRYGDFSFLIGKTADKNIINFFGEVMIRRGETVTADVLRQAKISGKLIELCLHVK